MERDAAQQDDHLTEADFQRILESSPGHCLVYRADGVLVYATPATLKRFHIEEFKQLLGKVNVLEDPSLSYAGLDMRGIFRRAMAGESFTLFNVKTPIKEITERFGKGEPFLESEFTTLYAFPLFGGDGAVSHVVTMMMPQRFYRGDPQALACREYIESHWLEPFDSHALSVRMAMSSSQVNKIFKAAYGLSPFAFYRRQKIDHLKEALQRPGASVKEAYAACGLTYNGSLAREFAEFTGYSPKAFQERQKAS